MQRYLCIQCDERFELEADQELRCPKCMRVHGIRPLAQAPERPARGRRLPWLLIGGLALAAAGAGGYAFYRRAQHPDPKTLATTPLRRSVLEAELQRQGIAPTEVGELAGLLDAGDAVERFAQRALSGQSNPVDKARAVVKALRAREKAQAFAAWPLTEPREGSLRVAEQVASAIEKDGARHELYPLELAALAVSALRSADVPAMLAEVYSWPGERRPLDPSGRFGYFAAALLDSAGKPAHVFDAYGGRAEQNACKDCKVLSDVEALGAALSLRASQHLADNEDPAKALHDADAAIKLLSSSAAVRCARGAILLANGANDLGQSELEAAAQMRPDGPRRNTLATLYLALGDSDRAAREVAQVLQAQPDFALAHVTLAQIHLAGNERALAQSELDKAESLDPRISLIPMTRAQMHAMANENDQAIADARRALQAHPKDPQGHLMLARIYKQAGQYGPMRAEVRSVLELVPQSMRERTHELIERLLGPTAFEPDVVPDDATATTSAPGGDLHLDLADPAAGSSPHVHLLDPQADPSAGTLQGQSGAPRLRLSAPGAGLKLHAP